LGKYDNKKKISSKNKLAKYKTFNPDSYYSDQQKRRIAKRL